MASPNGEAALLPDTDACTTAARAKPARPLWAEPQVGAIATQAYANPRYGSDGLALLREGASAEEVVERLTAADDGRDHRQLGVVDSKGGSATFTGAQCMAWA